MTKTQYRKVRCPVCKGNTHFVCIAQAAGSGGSLCDSCMPGDPCPFSTIVDECDNCNHTGWVYEEVGKEPELPEPDPNEGRRVKASGYGQNGHYVVYETDEEKVRREARKEKQRLRNEYKK
jgi:hypothetical protein